MKCRMCVIVSPPSMLWITAIEVQYQASDPQLAHAVSLREGRKLRCCNRHASSCIPIGE